MNLGQLIAHIYLLFWLDNNYKVTKDISIGLFPIRYNGTSTDGT
jgi:hypothetical protein